MAQLLITHMDDSTTTIKFPEATVAWSPEPIGLRVKHEQRGSRTVFPWATVKSCTVIPNP